MDFPIISYFEEAQAKLFGKSINIPMLYSTALILITQGANEILVPGFKHQQKIAATIKALPQSFRRRIRIIDTNSSILDKVLRFVTPIRDSLKGEEENSWEGLRSCQEASFQG